MTNGGSAVLRAGRRGRRGGRPRAGGLGEVGGAATAVRAQRLRRVAAQALGEHRGRRRRRSRPVASTSKPPSTSRTPAASSDLPPSTSARRAPASTTTRPSEPCANAIHSLRLDRRCRRGANDVPTGRPATASATTLGKRGRRDHRAHARPRRDLRGRELARHAAAPPFGARAADDLLERGVDLDDLLDERRVRVVGADRR